MKQFYTVIVSTREDKQFHAGGNVREGMVDRLCIDGETHTNCLAEIAKYSGDDLVRKTEWKHSSGHGYKNSKHTFRLCFGDREYTLADVETVKRFVSDVKTSTGAKGITICQSFANRMLELNPSKTISEQLGVLWETVDITYKQPANNGYVYDTISIEYHINHIKHQKSSLINLICDEE